MEYKSVKQAVATLLIDRHWPARRDCASASKAGKLCSPRLQRLGDVRPRLPGRQREHCPAAYHHDNVLWRTVRTSVIGPAVEGNGSVAMRSRNRNGD